MNHSAAELEAAIDQLEEERRAATAALFRSDQTPRYVPAEQRERESAIRMTYYAGLAAISGDIDAIVSEAAAEITNVAAGDPTARFTTAQLERISLRTPIVAEDLAHQPEAVQLQRLRATLTDSDSAERYIALRVGRLLLAEQARQQPAALPELRNGRPVVALPDYSGLSAAVRELEATFIDGKRRERAEARITEAQSVTGKLATSRYLQETYGAPVDRRVGVR